MDAKRLRRFRAALEARRVELRRSIAQLENDARTAEAFQGLRILGHVWRKKLESHEAAQVFIFCLVDDPHPATAELLNDAVVRNGLADHSRGLHSQPRMLAVENFEVNERTIAPGHS